MVTRKATLRWALGALALAPALCGAVQAPAPGGVVRPAPPPAPSETVRELARNLAEAADAHLDTARNLVLSAVEEIDGSAAGRQAVERIWSDQFTPDRLQAELAAEISARFPVPDQAAAARWDASLPAMRLELARRTAGPPPRASIDPRALTGDDVDRWRLAERMVDVCDLFERGTGLLLTVNLHASLAALRLTGMAEPFVEERRRELEQGLRAQLESNRPAMRERAQRSTFLANRRAAPGDLQAELDFFGSAAGQVRCRAQTDALETVLVRRIDDLPRIFAAAPSPD